MNSRTKGKVGELEWAEFLRKHGFSARRGRQYSGDPSAPDVVTDSGWHWEVKRVQALNLEAATIQAQRDSSSSKWAIAHRKNRGPWLVTMLAEEALKLIPKPMKLTVKQGGDFVLHPTGSYDAVLVDVIDLGMQEDKYAKVKGTLVRKVRLVWETSAKMEDGRPFVIMRTYTASLNSKSGLNKMLSQWRGKPLPEGEEVDLDKLIGLSCTLAISHFLKSNGNMGDSVDSVTKATRKMAPSGHWDRAAARDRVKTGANPPTNSSSVVDETDDVPF